MRKYITEKIGILALFQIIFSCLILCMGYYSFYLDVIWNDKVKKEGLHMCAKINQEVDKENNTVMLQTECSEILDITDYSICMNTIQADYLQAYKKFTVQQDNDYKDVKSDVMTKMIRWQASEVTFLVLVTCIAVFLLVHIIVASFVQLIEVRTKWNAALQGIILFTAGFAAMLLEISANTIENKYVTFSKEVRICGLLRFCDRTVDAESFVHKDYKNIINHALENHYACQAVRFKTIVSVLLAVIIVASASMILLAMDLITKYEQESEEREISQEQNVGNLVEDQNITFETLQEGADDNLDPEASRGRRLTLHGRDSETILADFLVHQEKSKPS